MVNYKEFSQKVKEQYPQYLSVDDKVLAERMLEKYPQYQEKVEFTEEPPITLQGKVAKSVNLTPSGIINGISNNISSALTAPITAIKNKIPLKDAFNSDKKLYGDFHNQSKFSKANDFLLDMALYGSMPEIKTLQGFKGAGLLNKGINGAYQGATISSLESLKKNGINPDKNLKDIKDGLTFQASLSAGVPPILKGTRLLLDKMGKPLLETGLNIARVPVEFAQQAIKPGSKANQLTPQEARQLLTHTTSRVQNNFKDLISKKGKAVKEATLKLNQNSEKIPVDELETVVDDVYKDYSLGGKVNYAENLAGDTKQKIKDLLNQAKTPGSKKQAFDSLTPADLYDITKQLGKMTNWNNPESKISNQILERIYGNYSKKLSSLSPELSLANKNFSELKNFQKNEGIRKILRRDYDIDSPSMALRNYKSTITKGNSQKNITDLENLLTNEGYEPFLKDIDDINAVDALNRRLETGDSSISNVSRNLLVKPILSGLNKLNRNGFVDELYKSIGKPQPSWLLPVLTGIKEKTY
ncbi:MAG: hypothetical protein ACLSWI_05360 [Candidatus Gastranaerophilaceae bacterium]